MKAKDDIDTVDHSIHSPFLCTVSISKYYSVSRGTNGFIEFLTNIRKTVCTLIFLVFFFFVEPRKLDLATAIIPKSCASYSIQRRVRWH